MRVPTLLDWYLCLFCRSPYTLVAIEYFYQDTWAAGKVFAHPAHLEARKNDLGARGADVDADARQRDVVGLPERVLFNGPRRTGVMIMIVVVIGLVLVGVLEIAAVRVVGERVRGFRRRRLAHSTRARVRDAT